MALTGRLALNGGVGLGVLQLHDKRVMNEELRGAFGAEYSLGASYDFFPYKKKLSGGLGLAPIVQVRFLPGDEATSIAVLFGLHVSWWTGLPRNQLDLPPGRATSASDRPAALALPGGQDLYVVVQRCRNNGRTAGGDGGQGQRSWAWSCLRSPCPPAAPAWRRPVPSPPRSSWRRPGR